MEKWVPLYFTVGTQSLGKIDRFKRYEIFLNTTLSSSKLLLGSGKLARYLPDSQQASEARPSKDLYAGLRRSHRVNSDLVIRKTQCKMTISRSTRWPTDFSLKTLLAGSYLSTLSLGGPYQITKFTLTIMSPGRGRCPLPCLSHFVFSNRVRLLHKRTL